SGGDGWIGDGELLACPRRIAHSPLQSGLHGTARAAGSADYRRSVQSYGTGALGDRGDFHDHGDSPNLLYVARDTRGACSAGRAIELVVPKFPMDLTQDFGDRPAFLLGSLL